MTTFFTIASFATMAFFVMFIVGAMSFVFTFNQHTQIQRIVNEISTKAIVIAAAGSILTGILSVIAGIVSLF